MKQGSRNVVKRFATIALVFTMLISMMPSYAFAPVYAEDVQAGTDANANQGSQEGEVLENGTGQNGSTNEADSNNQQSDEQSNQSSGEQSKQSSGEQLGQSSEGQLEQQSDEQLDQQSGEQNAPLLRGEQTPSSVAYNETLNEYYTTLKDAITAADGQGGSHIIKMVAGTTESGLVAIRTADITLDLNGNIIDGELCIGIINAGSKLTIKDSATGGMLKSNSTYGAIMNYAGTFTIESGSMEALESCVNINGAATVNVNGGTLTSMYNSVINANGTAGRGGYTINMNGGTLNASMTAAGQENGFIACGIYSSNSGTVNITGGTINVTGGAGIVARAGSVNISGGTIETTGNATGKVGDSRVVVPSSAIVYDAEAAYPGQTAESGISVTGGTFTSESNAVSVVPGESTERVQVSGGTFSNNVSDFAQEGYEVVDNGNGTYGVVEDLNYTAKFNAASYNLTAATYTMKATITLKDGTALTSEDKVGWTLVDESGVLVQSGNTTFSGKTASLKVTRADATSFASGSSTVALVKNGKTYATTTVNYSPSATISTDSSTKMIEEGAETVTALKINGVEVAIEDYVITSDDETAATVEKTGSDVTITPLKAGKATFTVAKASDLSESVQASITFKNAAAKIGDNYYDTVSKALTAANSGDTVTLVSDVTESVSFSGNKPRVDGFEITLDLAGHTLSGKADTAYALKTEYGIFTVKDSVGGGGVHYGSDYAFIVTHLAGDYTSRLVLDSGTFTGKTSVVQVGLAGGSGASRKYYGGELVVNGGTFNTVLDDGESYDADGHFKYTLNKLDYNASSYPGGIYSESDIKVYGGTFYNFDPMNNVAEGEGTNFVAEGYAAISVGEPEEKIYEVVELQPVTKAKLEVKSLLAGTEVKVDGQTQNPTPEVSATNSSQVELAATDENPFLDPHWYESGDISDAVEAALTQNTDKWLKGTVASDGNYYAFFVIKPKAGYYFDSENLPTVYVNDGIAETRYGGRDLFVLAKVAPAIAIDIELGVEHAGVAEELAAYMTRAWDFPATADGSTITAEVPAYYHHSWDDEGRPEHAWDVAHTQFMLDSSLESFFNNRGGKDQGKVYGFLGQKEQSEYADWETVEAEEIAKGTPNIADLTERLTLYALWGTPVSEVDLQVASLIAGTQVEGEDLGQLEYKQEPQPNVYVETEHVHVRLTEEEEERAYWFTKDAEGYTDIMNGTAEAGENYVAAVDLGCDFPYLFDAVVSASVNGNKITDENHAYRITGNILEVSAEIPVAVARIGDRYFKTLGDARGATKSDGSDTVVLLTDVNEFLYVGKTNFTLDLNGHTLSNTKDDDMLTVWLAEESTLTIKDSSLAGTGKIVSGKGTAVKNYNNLTVESGTIIGKTYGVENTDASWDDYAATTINGGTIIGGTASVYNKFGADKFTINGGLFSDDAGNADNITRKAGMRLFPVSGEGEYKDYYELKTVVAKRTVKYIDEENPEAEPEEKEFFYTSLHEAIDAVTEDDETVTLLVDTTDCITFDEGRRWTTLDLNGKTLTVDQSEGVMANGILAKLTIENGTINAAEDAEDIISSSSDALIILGENLTVNAATSALYAYDRGNIYVEGAIVNGGSKYATAFVTGAYSTIHMESGEINGPSANHPTVSVKNGAFFFQKGGEVNATHSSALRVEGQDSKAEILGGVLKTSSKDPAFCAGFATNKGKIIVASKTDDNDEIVSSGKVVSENGGGLAAANNGIIEIGETQTDGSFTGDGVITVPAGQYALIAHEGGNAKVTIYSGTVNGAVGAGSTNGAGAVTVEGGTINGDIYSNNGTMTVEGGVVNGEVYNRTGDAAKFQINGGAFKTDTGNGDAFKRKNDEMLVKSADAEHPDMYALAAAVASITRDGKKTYYETLGAAHESVAEGETIVLEDDIDLGTSCYQSTRTYTLDLNGHTIKSKYDDNKGLIWQYGNGKLTITDSSNEKTGAIINEGSGYAVFSEWHKTLNIEAGTIKANKDAILCGGIVTINGGVIESGRNALKIYDDSTRVTINEGSIKGQSATFTNITAGTVAINGGKFSDDTGNGDNFTRPANKYLADKDGDGWYELEDVDKTELNNAIAAATEDEENTKKSPDSEDGKDIPDGETYVKQSIADAIKEAIEAAKAVANNTAATQKKVDDATTAMNAAKDAFDAAKQTASVDRDELEDAIIAAENDKTATMISEDGKDLTDGTVYVNQEAQDALKAAIEEANEVLEKPKATQNEVDNAKAAIEAAKEAFDNAKKTASVSKTDLNNALTAANNANEDTAQSEDGRDLADGTSYASQTAKEALATAIEKAQRVADDENAFQIEVDEAVQALEKATETFNKAVKTAKVEKDELNSAIENAENDKKATKVSTNGRDVPGGDNYVDQEAADALEEAIGEVKAVSEDPEATQNQVDDALDKMNAAQEAFEAAKNTAETNKDDLTQAVSDADEAVVAASDDGKDVPAGDEYTGKAAREAFDEVVNAAKEVLDNPKSTQEQIDAAEADVKAALDAYNEAKKTATVDKEALEEALGNADEEAEEELSESENGRDLPIGTRYVSASAKRALADAMEKAQSVFDNPKATQNEVDAAKEQVEAATKAYEDAIGTAGGEELYDIVEGEGTTWTKGTSDTAEFVFKRARDDSETFSHFQGIEVDGARVNTSDYTAVSGSVIVNLKAAYLETLAVGEHTLTAIFEDGNNVTTKFFIKAEADDKKEEEKTDNKEDSKNSDSKKNEGSNPATGDINAPVLAIILIIEILALIAVIVYRRRYVTSQRKDR